MIVQPLPQSVIEAGWDCTLWLAAVNVTTAPDPTGFGVGVGAGLGVAVGTAVGFGVAVGAAVGLGAGDPPVEGVAVGCAVGGAGVGCAPAGGVGVTGGGSSAIFKTSDVRIVS